MKQNVRSLTEISPIINITEARHMICLIVMLGNSFLYSAM